MKKVYSLLLKIFPAIVFTMLFFSHCVNDDLPETTSTDTTKIAQPIVSKISCDSTLPIDLINASSLNRWIDFYTNKYPNFKLVDFKFQTCSKEDSFLTHTYEPPKEYMDLYKSLIIYSHDSSMFIDMDSYNFFLKRDKKGNLTGAGGDPETEVALINLKEHTHTRLLYYGPSSIIEDVQWIDKNTLAVAYLADTENAYCPNIILIDLGENTFSYFKNPTKIEVKSIRDYSFKVRWKSIKIKQ